MGLNPGADNAEVLALGAVSQPGLDAGRPTGDASLGLAATLNAWASPRLSCLQIPWSALLTTHTVVS